MSALLREQTSAAAAARRVNKTEGGCSAWLFSFCGSILAPPGRISEFQIHAPSASYQGNISPLQANLIKAIPLSDDSGCAKLMIKGQHFNPGLALRLSGVGTGDWQLERGH